jgi:adenosylcobinamide-GDP ribazoletransferase
MAHGPPKRKIQVMHDKVLGAGGFTLGLFTPLITVASIVSLPPNLIIQSLIISEVSAKLSMVAASRFGKAAHEGMGSIVVDAMHRKNGNIKLVTAFLVSLGIAGIILGHAGLASVVSSIICALLMTAIAHNQFKGLTGDVLGATNEMSRMVSLATLLVVIR